MKARTLTRLACLVAAMTSASYGTWWLLVDQQAAIDTIAGSSHHLEPIPMDGLSVSQSFVVPSGGTDSMCVRVANNVAVPRKVVLQLLTDQHRRPGNVLARTMTEVPPGRQCVAAPVLQSSGQHGTTWWVSLRAVSAEASSGLQVEIANDNALTQGQLLWGTSRAGARWA